MINCHHHLIYDKHLRKCYSCKKWISEGFIIMTRMFCPICFKELKDTINICFDEYEKGEK